MPPTPKFKVGDQVAVLAYDGEVYRFETIKSLRVFTYKAVATTDSGDRYDASSGYSSKGGFRCLRIDPLNDEHRRTILRQERLNFVQRSFDSYYNNVQSMDKGPTVPRRAFQQALCDEDLLSLVTIIERAITVAQPKA